jgi:hypothetical protein
MAIERWRPYLKSQEFIIKTDHKSLAYLNEQTLQLVLQRKAMTSLMGLQFNIIYRKGRDNIATEALSRTLELMQINSYSEVKPLWIQLILMQLTQMLWTCWHNWLFQVQMNRDTLYIKV